MSSYSRTYGLRDVCVVPPSLSSNETRNAFGGVDPKDVELAENPCVLVDVGIANS